MKYVLKKDVDVDEFIEELENLDGINVSVETVDDVNAVDTVEVVVTSNAIRLELHRVMILLEEQGEIELAIQKLHCLDDLFERMQNCELGFKV